jgi:predicted CxxxxCH...CXXCH cytochrome family protein
MRIDRIASLMVMFTALLSGCSSARQVADDGGAGGATTCNVCHGFPPAAPHPQRSDCAVCHGDTVNPDNTLIAGGPHNNGTVDVTGGHSPGFANPAVHGPAAVAAIVSCTACHGDDYAGGALGAGGSCNQCHANAGFADWKTNCTFCHGTQTASYGGAPDAPTVAPPESVSGSDTSAVGAHQKHLGVGSSVTDGVGCSACHTVPDSIGTPGHLDAPTVVFGTQARVGGTTPTFDGATCSNTYCHGNLLRNPKANVVPSWTATGGFSACDACHSPQSATGGYTDKHSVGAHKILCSGCHGAGYAAGVISGTARSTHVDGAVTIAPFMGYDAAGTAAVPHSYSGSCHGVDGKSWY